MNPVSGMDGDYVDSAVSDYWALFSENALAVALPFLTAVLAALLVLSVLRYQRLNRRVQGLSLEMGSASRSLRNADRDLRTLFDQSAIAVMLLDRSNKSVLYANETAMTAFGARTEEQLTASVMQKPDAWSAAPFSLLDFEEIIYKTGRSGLQKFEWYFEPVGRRPVWLDSSLSIISYKGGQALMFTGVNITDRKHAEKADRYRHKAMTSMANDNGLHATLDHLAAMAESRMAGARCGVMVHNVEGARLRWVGGRSIPEAFRETLDGVPVAFGAASCGTAVFIRGRVVTRDVRSDDRWDRYRDDAELAGLRACWSEPVLGSSGELLGTFDVYHDEPWTPGDDDIDALTDPIAIASLAIERHQAKGQLEQMVLSEQMVRRISTDLLTLDPEETDEGLTSTCRALGGFYRADRVFLCQLEEASQQVWISHEWAGEGFNALCQHTARKYPVITAALAKVFAGKASVIFSTERDIPPQLEFLQDLLALRSNQSVLLAMVHRGDRMSGILGIQMTAPVNPWTPQRSQTAELMANLFGSALNRNQLLHSLTYQAVHDQLTGLYNRHKIESFMDQEVARCTRYGSTFSLIIFDLDHFKSINDRFGHNEGDAVLSSVSSLVSNGIRESEIAGRWGGEEFLIILPETSLDSAVPVADRLRSSIESHRFSIPEPVTISVGVAAFRPGDTPHELIQRADAALYSAKESGRNCVKQSF
ncbi:diguanylate cyclase [Marinobacter sp. DUT-3]|uniref:sensor domain-containing diguanylate cyclase n=1 Tax=Marinobacter sp. DUT-3 TaxID=3412036 RepID=UPI003D16F249